MPTHLYLAPAAAGKTAHVLDRAREVARDLAAVPRVVVPTHLQTRAARQRLADIGGALGVRVLTFDLLYAEVLDAAGEIYVELSDPVQYRLIHGVVDSLPLAHYAPLADRRSSALGQCGATWHSSRAARSIPADVLAAPLFHNIHPPLISRRGDYWTHHSLDGLTLESFPCKLNVAQLDYRRSTWSS